jgi:hypothetical protein
MHRQRQLNEDLLHLLNDLAHALVKASDSCACTQMGLYEIGISSPKQARLWCDNLGAKYLDSNPVFHERVKHTEIDYHFI